MIKASDSFRFRLIRISLIAATLMPPPTEDCRFHISPPRHAFTPARPLISEIAASQLSRRCAMPPLDYISFRRAGQPIAAIDDSFGHYHLYSRFSLSHGCRHRLH